MCGIVAIYAYAPSAPPVQRAELFRIRDYMAARGPDAAGAHFETERLALGHRRLAIIDLSAAGSQPMASHDDSLVVTFNGEIYNYRALRAELERHGRRFRTQSDTEVLLQLYAEHGEDMVQKLRGMFAFALWDSRRKALFLARDPYGIKPLYIADDGKTVRVASQVKALLAGGAVTRALDPAGIAGFLTFGSVPEPFTCHRGIRALPAGCFAWVDASGVGVPFQHFSVARTFRQAQAQPDLNLSPAATEECARAALVDSVRHHLVADVPVGAFLSGGVDSAAVVGLMRNVGQRDIRTVTLAFSEFYGTPADESPGAADSAAVWGTEHTTSMIDAAGFATALPRVLDSMDQPSIDGINTWFVCRAAREAGLKVVLSGVGGDELFGGYPSFSSIPRWVRTIKPLRAVPGMSVAAQHLLAYASSVSRQQLSPKLAGLLRYGGTYAGAYLLKRGLFLPEELPALMGASEARAGLAALAPLSLIGAGLRPDPRAPFGRVATLEATLYLRNQLLRDSDWASMSHSLELRTPLVDADLLRALAPLVVRQTVGKGKTLLAAAPRPPVRSETVLRQKTGFALPMAEWMQHAVDDSWRACPGLLDRHCHWSRRLAYVLVARLRSAASDNWQAD